MPERKKIKEHRTGNDLKKRLARLGRGLYFISETDAEILAFRGKKAESVTKEALMEQIGKSFDCVIEERVFADFFAPLTKVEDWFGEEEKKTSERFLELRDFLQKELKDLKVFRVGSIELDIYVVGTDSDGILAGIKTKAVET